MRCPAKAVFPNKEAQVRILHLPLLLILRKRLKQDVIIPLFLCGDAMMRCPNNDAEMEQIPSTIQVGKQILGDPRVKLFRCPICKRIKVEGL